MVQAIQDDGNEQTRYTKLQQHMFTTKKLLAFEEMQEYITSIHPVIGTASENYVHMHLFPCHLRHQQHTACIISFKPLQVL